MIFDIRLRDFDDKQIRLRVTKKPNDKGYQTKAYETTSDLWRALARATAQEEPRRRRQPARRLPVHHQARQGLHQGIAEEPVAGRAREAGPQAREITFHDMRAKAASDASSVVAAQELLHHEDVKVTKRVYRRKVPSSKPLPSAIGGRDAA
jgi:integrase